jgi:hypothetical protein
VGLPPRFVFDRDTPSTFDALCRKLAMDREKTHGGQEPGDIQSTGKKSD